MTNSDERLMKTENILLRCEDIIGSEWSEFSFVFEFFEGDVSNSGFLYFDDVITPAIAEVEGELMLLDDSLEALREGVYQQTGYNFNQLLFQMERKTKRFNMDFEFDDPTRWLITPSNVLVMREKLRPEFERVSS